MKKYYKVIQVKASPIKAVATQPKFSTLTSKVVVKSANLTISKLCSKFSGSRPLVGADLKEAYWAVKVTDPAKSNL